MRKLLATSAATAAGISFKIVQSAEVDWSRNCIVMANHSSILDITAVLKACPIPLSFMGKVELLNNPVTGFFFKRVDIPVSRASKFSSFRALKQAEAFLSEGKNIVIFPEGGISDNYPPPLNAFKSGGFRLASSLKVPIVPIVIEDAWQLYWDDGKRYGSSPGTITIRVLEPIMPCGDADEADRLRDQTYNLFKKHLPPNRS